MGTLPLAFVTVLCYTGWEEVGMLYDWFTAERLALERHRLRLLAGERRCRLDEKLREVRVRRDLDRALSRAMRALPPEEIRALLARALRATG